jgi:exodeoxyribonuclease VII large subunit
VAHFGAEYAFDSLIKTKIINNEAISIAVLIGKSAIIDEDIKHQLKEAIGFYKLCFIRINLCSEREIIESLTLYARKNDIVVLSRG